MFYYWTLDLTSGVNYYPRPLSFSLLPAWIITWDLYPVFLSSMNYYLRPLSCIYFRRELLPETFILDLLPAWIITRDLYPLFTSSMNYYPRPLSCIYFRCKLLPETFILYFTYGMNYYLRFCPLFCILLPAWIITWALNPLFYFRYELLPQTFILYFTSGVNYYLRPLSWILLPDCSSELENPHSAQLKLIKITSL